MNLTQISKETETKRLEDFKKIAENWDNIPEYAKGKLDGTIETIASVCIGSGKDNEKAG